MVSSVLQAYGFNGNVHFQLFGNGLINNTWKVTAGKDEYILQRVNNNVFKSPQSIAHNIRIIAEYLSQHHPEYLFVKPIKTAKDEEMVFQPGEGFFRLFPFIKNSFSKNVVQTPEEAYEAAKQFGKFTKLLSNMEVKQLKNTIPSFHDLELRYRQFLQSLEEGNKNSILHARELVNFLKHHAGIVADYKKILSNPDFKIRVTHHDTKISNVLFDHHNKGICVIDLDTVMPGYFISDVGDMMRTYLSPVNEEEADINKIEVRVDFYKAILQGYCSEMKNQLTAVEKESFFYAGKCMIYMQALRFITDYFNGDQYYGAAHPTHNYDRAANQVKLLKSLIEKEAQLKGLRL